MGERKSSKRENISEWFKRLTMVSFNNERCVFWWEIVHYVEESAHYLKISLEQIVYRNEGEILCFTIL